MISWSCGGGLQSVAIGVLVREGTLPVPDLAAIVDTGRERRTTWDYLHDVLQPYLDPAGLKIEVVPHSFARMDLYGPSGLTLIPAYTAEGRLPTFCSGKWKQDAMWRWLRSRGVRECECWIGYSIDEVRRVPQKDGRKWCKLRFPLIDLMLNRAMCARLITAAGLPLPHKSRCWMCPHQTPEEWAEVKADPEEWAAAVALEGQINERDPERKGLYLSRLRVPLGLADFGNPGLAAPARPCDGEGGCWT